MFYCELIKKQTYSFYNNSHIKKIHPNSLFILTPSDQGIFFNLNQTIYI